MKDLLGSLLVGLIWLAIILMSTAFAISVGYFLYLWGSIGIALNVAAWTAFTLWLKLECLGLLVLLASLGTMLFL